MMLLELEAPPGLKLKCIAQRIPARRDWPPKKRKLNEWNMRAKNAPKAAQYVKRQYRKGWEL